MFFHSFIAMEYAFAFFSFFFSFFFLLLIAQLM